MENIDYYSIIIAGSLIVIVSFLFSGFARRTNIPSVLMLIGLGIGIKAVMDAYDYELGFDFQSVLPLLGTVGLIMIVLEAALELELRRDKLMAIGKALVIALIGLLGGTWLAAMILEWQIEGMDTLHAWLYATPLSILSSAIVIPSVGGLSSKKKEFHIYESTFSDILGIMQFTFLEGMLEKGAVEGATDFTISFFLTIGFAIAASYALIFIFQNIKTSVKLFLLISILLLLYALGNKMHLSSLLIILFFGLTIANMRVFFRGRLGKWLNFDRAHTIYEGLHVVTGETAFIVRTFFFVVFGITIVLSHLLFLDVAIISGLILLSIYGFRFLTLYLFLGRDIMPQWLTAPRGLITILLFYKIPKEHMVDTFEPGILIFIIITTGLIMTFALIYDRQRSGKAIGKAMENVVGYGRWKVPTVEGVAEEGKENGAEAPKEGH